MTIVTTATSSGPYTAAAQTTFAVTFYAASASEIEVTLNDVVQATNLYTFSRDDDGTGEVIFTSAVTGQVMIYSKPVFDQQTAFSRFGAFFPDQINGPLDKAAAKSLYLKERVDTLYPARVPADRAGRFLAWDAEGDPIAASGTGADSALRTDLAATNGALLVKANARRSVYAVQGDGPWLGDVGVGALTDQQAFEYAGANAIPVLRVPPRPITTTAIISPIAPIQLQGFGGGRAGATITIAHNGPFIQTLGPAATGGPITVSMDGLRFEGDLAFANCGVADLFDNGNGMMSNMLVSGTRGTAFRNKFGVALTYDNIRFSLPVGAKAIDFDGIGDFQNGSVLRSLYVSGGTTPFQFISSGGIVMIGCQADAFTSYGMSGTGGGAHMIGCFFESAGTNPGLLTDFDLTFDDQTRWTHGDWVQAWSGVAGSQRMQMIGKPMFGSGSRLTAYAPAAADTWYAVPLTTDEPIYFAIHYAGGTAAQESNIQFERPGVVELSYEAHAASAGTAGKANAQLFHFAAGVDQSVLANGTPIVGSGSQLTLAANSTGRLIGGKRMKVLTGEAVCLAYGSSATSITLAVPAGGAGNGPAFTSPLVARLCAKTTGAIS